MLQTILRYICLCLTGAFPRSFRDALNLASIFGAGAIAAILHYRGEEMIFPAGPWGVVVSAIVYTVAAWIILFVGRAIFISPFQLWNAEREARIIAEIKANNREERKNIRETIAAFMSEGKSLMSQCFKDNVPPPTYETNKWIGSVEEYLIKALDKSYIERMHTAAGITLTLVQPDSSEHKHIWQVLYTRVCRLQEFVKELSHD
jgi:hypothetical protein